MYLQMEFFLKDIVYVIEDGVQLMFRIKYKITIYAIYSINNITKYILVVHNLLVSIKIIMYIEY